VTNCGEVRLGSLYALASVLHSHAGALLIVGLLAAIPGCGKGSLSKAAKWAPIRVDDPGIHGTPESYSDLEFVDPSHGWVARLALERPSGVLYTADGGRMWVDQQARCIQLDFVDQRIGWAKGHGGAVARTADAGASWTWNTANERLLDIAAVSEKEAWAIGQNGLLHTRDGGASWKVVSLPRVAATASHLMALMAICCLGANDCWVIGCVIPDDLRIFVFRTQDGGKTFEVARVPQVTIANLSPHRIQFRNLREGWAAIGGPGLLHTVDGGRTWTVVTPVVRGLGTDFCLLDCSFGTSLDGWAVGSTGDLPRSGRALALHTGDGGKTWERVRTGAETIVQSWVDCVVFVDARHGWISGKGGIPPGDMPPRPSHQVSFVLRYVP